MEWRNVYRGILMGASNLVPGVSAGTIALIFGIYDHLIASISDFFSSKWRDSLKFLLPLGIGVIAGFVGLIHIIRWLHEHHYQPTQFFFLGLIIGVIPLLLTQSNMKTQFKVPHFVMLLVTAVGVGLMGFLPEEGSGIIDLTPFNGIKLFIAGWLASASLLLPGISGAAVLLIFGVYDTAIEALYSMNIPVIGLLGGGLLIGFAMSSKIIKYVLKQYPYMTYAVIIGLLVGSLVIVFPGFSAGPAALFPSAVTFLAGALTAILLGSRS
ncbi:DUF368 domain-containing protein [Salipaludibacillus agaradhaerens]|jgi:putative membrane protein|uniref:DUF368 domain-containing protein n=1 Tax=Salipaludibacillus agaradhaerens TaxID=76935 RepID=A0A9Q4FZQ3_SALAG|nr:DUF368 domain-containing protein [Salipaludibacillus agaradhaerens]MCR6096979.1 DUF368 domain-containing protein [Salipaludibacillus agaradhaerens]MCR6113536.1 DUF368 domain-containing protein [Salipaludibacillus agaradhaerens]